MSEAKKALDKLFSDLKNDLDSEKMYWLRNDAKLKAVVTSKSYEEFRDTVDAAHLKGVSREDCKKKSAMNNTWNKGI